MKLLANDTFFSAFPIENRRVCNIWRFDLKTNSNLCSLQTIGCLLYNISGWSGQTLASHVSKTASWTAGSLSGVGAARTLQRVVKAAQCNQVRLTISGKNPTHSSHSVLTAIPSGRRLRTITAKTTRLKSRFIPQAVRLLKTPSGQPSNGTVHPQLKHKRYINPRLFISLRHCNTWGTNFSIFHYIHCQHYITVSIARYAILYNDIWVVGMK